MGEVMFCTCDVKRMNESEFLKCMREGLREGISVEDHLRSNSTRSANIGARVLSVAGLSVLIGSVRTGRRG